MGSAHWHLEWHLQSEINDSWVARIAKPYDTAPDKVKYRRFAHVNILPWHTRHKKGKHSVDLLDAFKADEQYYWFDSLDEAKRFVEAIYALTTD
jgi:hypothetical protein